MSSSGNPSALVALAPVTSAPASTPTSAIAVVTQPSSRLLPAPAPIAAMNAKPISGPPCAPMLAKPDAAAITTRAPAKTRGCRDARGRAAPQPVGHPHRPDGEGDRLDDQVAAGRRGVAEGRHPDQDGPASAE